MNIEIYKIQEQSNMERIIIDNCVVERSEKSLYVCSMKMAKKRNMNLANVEKKSYGSKMKDNEKIRQLLDGKINFENL